MTVALAAVMMVGCTLEKADPPAPAGPSELGLSLSLQAIPDTITQDGSSQAQVAITARDSNGQAAANIPLRAELQVANTVVDFGRLSARTLVTGNDGRAFLTYTAPPAPAESVDGRTIVTVVVTPAVTDHRNSLGRSVDIRLVPPGVILPPQGTPTPTFVFSPAAPLESSPVQFDASASTADAGGVLVGYAWDFGDGGTATGRTASHTFKTAGSFTVTLTVTDDRGHVASTSRVVTVAAGANPTASFSISPTSGIPGQQITFNAQSSRAAQGRTLVGFTWDFGDGSRGSGVTATHAYASSGTYSVTLQVTDDAEKTAAVAQLVTIVASLPTASFSFSPSNPIANQEVAFSAVPSTPGPGHTLTGYAWDFGDGGRASGVTTTHRFTADGTYTVTLTVTDEVGTTAVARQSVIVATARPTATFAFSPNNPAPGQTIVFNAQASQAAPGRTLTSFIWDFGDGSGLANLGTNPIVTHAFTIAGNFLVTLRVTDSDGLTATVTQTVPVATGTPGGPIASFTASPTNPARNQLVTFNGSASSSPSGIVSYTWDFGDAGSTVTTTSPITTHTYTAAGTFVVRLTVTDGAGRTATVTVQVPVT